MAKQLFPVTFNKPGQPPREDKDVKTFDTRGFRRPEKPLEASKGTENTEDPAETEDGQEGATEPAGGNPRRLGSV